LHLAIIVIVANIGDKVSCSTIAIGITVILIECEALINFAVTLALAASVNG